MDSVIIHGHKSLEALQQFQPKSGTFHKTDDSKGLILAHGNKLYEIPFMEVMAESTGTEDGAQDSDGGEDNGGAGTDDSSESSDSTKDSEEASSDNSSTSSSSKSGTSVKASASADTSLPLAKKKSS